MPRTLQSPSTADDVRFLQTSLNASPPTALPVLTLDGEFGPDLDARVREYQGNNALFVDGVVGPITWGSILGRSVVETSGFCGLGRDLFDRLGNRVILRGINKMSVYDCTFRDFVYSE